MRAIKTPVYEFTPAWRAMDHEKTSLSRRGTWRAVRAVDPGLLAPLRQPFARSYWWPLSRSLLNPRGPGGSTPAEVLALLRRSPPPLTSGED